MKTLVMLSILATRLFALEVGDVAPCVVLEGFSSQSQPSTRCIRDREDQNQRFTIVDFALTTCEACTHSIPQLSWLSSHVNRDATTRVVYVDDSKQTVLNFLTAHTEDIKFATALDVQQKAMKAWGVSLLPATIVIDKKNVVVYKHEGQITDEIQAEIEKVVTK